VITKCDVCCKVFRFTKKSLSLVSLSVTGEIVLSHICDECSIHQENVDELMRKNDQILDVKDSLVGGLC